MAARNGNGNKPHATLYDFRDSDIMFRLAESEQVDSYDLAEALGFEAEDGARPVGIRLAWMRRYGMVVFDENARTWSLSRSGQRVVEAKLRAPTLAVVDRMPDEAMVEVMAHVTSRFQRGESMLGHMLRREFLYGTEKGKRRR
jgi:hypothetical protein